MEQYTKPFLSIPDQITKIHDRGLKISDQAKATDYLSKIGYYRLSGYWYPLRQSQLVNGEDGRPTMQVQDDFRDGSEFAQVVHLYVFDKRLRLLMLDVLERIEVAL
ncbi:MAG: Abi family protein [Cognatishimia sp.]|nr:Abi family protein [Cognatishimia sp.]